MNSSNDNIIGLYFANKAIVKDFSRYVAKIAYRDFALTLADEGVWDQKLANGVFANLYDETKRCLMKHKTFVFNDVDINSARGCKVIRSNDLLTFICRGFLLYRPNYKRALTKGLISKHFKSPNYSMTITALLNAGPSYISYTKITKGINLMPYLLDLEDLQPAPKKKTKITLVMDEKGHINVLNNDIAVNLGSNLNDFGPDSEPLI